MNAEQRTQSTVDRLEGVNPRGREILGAMPGTRSEIAAKLGLSIATVRYHVELLHQRDHKCHVLDWQEGHGGKLVPVMVAGAGQDAPYPSGRAKLPRSVVRARWVAIARKSGYWGKVLEQRRARYQKRQQAAGLWAAPLFTEPRRYY